MAEDLGGTLAGKRPGGQTQSPQWASPLPTEEVLPQTQCPQLSTTYKGTLVSN